MVTLFLSLLIHKEGIVVKVTTFTAIMVMETDINPAIKEIRVLLPTITAMAPVRTTMVTMVTVIDQDQDIKGLIRMVMVATIMDTEVTIMVTELVNRAMDQISTTERTEDLDEQ
jgi:hypothetical protein